MSEDKANPGTISWHDLTVPNADTVRDFYAAVVGWRPDPVEMGGYSDYCMIPPGAADPAAGVCHQRGVNAGLPAQWLMYINVSDVDAAAKKCKELGGTVLAGPKNMGPGRYCVISDPAGAVCALYTPNAT